MKWRIGSRLTPNVGEKNKKDANPERRKVKKSSAFGVVFAEWISSTSMRPCLHHTLWQCVSKQPYVGKVVKRTVSQVRVAVRCRWWRGGREWEITSSRVAAGTHQDSAEYLDQGKACLSDWRWQVMWSKEKEKESASRKKKSSKRLNWDDLSSKRDNFKLAHLLLLTELYIHHKKSRAENIPCAR